MRSLRERIENECVYLVASEEPPASYQTNNVIITVSGERKIICQKSPNKKMEVIGSLAKKYKIRSSNKKEEGQKYKDLSEE